ncbi:MAG: peptidoglycan DD-metalloendopeptidase family protein [Bacteroidales bacterium]|nr:peptidoglycan DD-metalloendopeptidase family protein [Bacteroidales bacterium]MDD4001918.1 peptidoglycan DD-metalloendopeptidase family protein [Bacteroidales bacterium]MDD4528898.1 peptidoglycan DD-metalloendopeptidase family protein [Bacteroidales bacterium]MDD4828958.1 peptidoglycan DD-metalloendopeptidase family protein [Bacteroidales bacterium]
MEDEKAKIEREINAINAILKETKNTKRMSASELSILKKKIDSRQKLINNISKQMNILNGEITNTQKSIIELNNEIEVLKKEYAKMLRYAQKNRTATDKILFIFSSKDYRQAYQRFVFFRQYGDMQKNMMYNIQNKFDELEKKTSELTIKKKNQENLLQQEEKNKKVLTSEQAVKQKNIRQLTKKEKQLAKQIKEKQQRRKKLQNQINQAIAAEVRKQTNIASKKNANKSSTSEPKAQKSKKQEYVMSATPEEVQLSNSFSANRGKLPWPTEQGVVTSSFGTHPHPDIKGIMIENNGIDIRTPKGASIRAVFEGVVSKVFTGPNGQQIIIIRHGEYLSVYTNLSSVNVSNGSKVSTKQKLGTVYTNGENVSEFNFQVWKGNNKQNPSSWIR